MAYKPSYKSYTRQQQTGDNGYAQKQPYPHLKHWKSYLAPELSNQDHERQQYDQEQPDSYFNARAVGREREKGVRSQEYLHNEGKLQRSIRSGAGDRGGKEREDQYSRRKDQILNRIKALQDKTAGKVNGKRHTENSEAKLQYDDVQGRLAALEERVDNMESQFQTRIERVVRDLQARFGFR